MKKALSLILALVLCLSLCACGETKSNEIELTLDNYADYLRIRVYVNGGRDLPADNVSFYDMNGKLCSASEVSSYFTIGCNVEGVSSNFTYSDIVIEVKATGKYIACNRDKKGHFGELESSIANAFFTHSVVCDLDVSGTGKGSGTEKYIIPDNLVMPEMLYAHSKEFECEIISVSGTVKPIN